MKSMFFTLVLIIASASFANDENTLKVTTKLNSEESYRLYEHMNVPEVADPDGRTLVKRSDHIVCTRSGYYPGDREYECSVTFAVDSTGTIVN